MCSETVDWAGCHDNAAAATVGSFGATVAHHGDGAAASVPAVQG